MLVRAGDGIKGCTCISIVCVHLQGSFPARLKKVLIVLAPLWFKAPFKILRLFVREKLRDRVRYLFSLLRYLFVIYQGESKSVLSQACEGCRIYGFLQVVRILLLTVIPMDYTGTVLGG